MHFVCEKNVLAAALGIVQRTVATKSPLPALKGVLLETEESGLVLSGTNLEFGIKCSLQAKIIEHGAVVLPAKLLTEFIRKMPDGMIDASSHSDNPLNINIACGNIKFDLSGYPAEEFPKLAEASSDAARLAVEEGLLKEMFSQTEVAIARDETRPILTGLLLETEANKLKLVATDGHRLAFRQAAYADNTELKAVIPGKAIREVSKILEDAQDKKVEICLDDTCVVFIMDGIVLSSRLVEGKYPPYQQIIPTDFKTSVVADAQALQAALERAEIIVREGGNNLVLLQVDQGITVIGASQDVGRVEDFVPAEVQGEPLEIRFNVRLLLDCFHNIKDQQVHLDFTGPYSPCMIRPFENHNYLHLVLPVRLS